MGHHHKFQPRAAVERARRSFKAAGGQRRDWAPMCPDCGAPEDHPTDRNRVLVRGYKLVDADGRHWSQCLVCASAEGRGGYNEELEWTGPLAGRELGWF
jgi:hypothetical protein